MTFNVLWPAMRWPGDREIESSSVGDNQAIFCERYADVTAEQWASADAVVTVNDIPDEFREKLVNCRIVVTTKVGFENIELKSWQSCDFQYEQKFFFSLT